MKRQKVGVIGWLKHYDEEYALTTAVCDVSQEKLDQFHAHYPKPALYRDYREMAAKAQLDAVIISTPNWLHKEMAIEFLGRGVHVFVEKPMGVDKSEIDAILAAQRRSGKLCAIDFELRVSGIIQRVMKIIAAGEIGALNGIEFIHHRGAWLAAGNGVWRTDLKLCGGLFLMEICHEIDLFRLLFGEITHVQSFKHANVLPQYPADFPDNAVTHIWFEGGQRGTLIVSHTSSTYDAPIPKYDDLGHDMYLIITGTEGFIRMETVKQKLLIGRYADFHPDAPRGKRVEFSRLEDYTSCVSGVFMHDIRGNQAAFLRSCATGTPFHQDTLDAWKTHVVCIAAEKSALEDSQKIAVDYTLP